MKQAILKAYFGGIFFECALQERLADAVIILLGFPGKMEQHALIEEFASRGYHVFLPRYRGSFQSKGQFLSKNPIDDLMVFMRSFEQGSVKSLWDLRKRQFRVNKKLLVGSSFGGAIACGLAAKSGAFSHLILLAPIWDFAVHNENKNEEDLARLTMFVKRAYENVYRIKWKNVQERMLKWREMRPDYYAPLLQKLPILVFHDPNDKVVSFAHTKAMVSRFERATLVEHYLGHGASADLIRTYWKEIDKFVKVNYLE